MQPIVADGRYFCHAAPGVLFGRAVLFGRVVLLGLCRGFLLMTASYVFVLACGSLAVLYGIFVTRSVLATSAGTEDMRRIAEAVQEGAAAYLRRQYVTIAAVGAVIGGFLGWRLGAPWPTAF